MSNDIDRLAAALKAAPAPDARARDEAIARALAEFDRMAATGQEHAGQGGAAAEKAPQGSPALPRPKEDRPLKAGFLNGVLSMLHRLSRRPLLAGTASAAALFAGLVLILPLSERITPGLPPVPPPSQTPAASPAPEAAPSGAPVAPAAEAPVAGEAASGLPPLPAAEPAPAPADTPATAPPSVDASAAVREDRARTGSGPAAADTGMAAPPALAAPAFAPELAPLPPPSWDGESWANAPENPVQVTAEVPVSTFSVDVDTASWAAIRSSLAMGMLPDPEQVRIEEMVNYFPYDYPAPGPGQAFATTIAVMPTPWNPGTQLVTIGLQGAQPAITDRPPLNLVFLVDTSGSMEAPNKLPLLKQSLALMLPELRPEDRIAIVAYAGSAGVVLEPTAASERARILDVLDHLIASGSTAGGEGLALAYRMAEDMAGEGRLGRILLATDGDFNVGINDPAELKSFVERQREKGIYLSVLGFGRGNLNDATMQALAQNGNGTASYIDTLAEARKVLVDQLTGALFPIADDVKVQVEWNPARVAEYRLIGYETRALRREDFNNDRVDAGEIGAGLQVTAIYEVTPPDSPALLNDPLRYGAPAAGESVGPDEMGFLRLRWKAPGETVSQLVETPITGQEPATTESRFAAAIAGFGQLLRHSAYTGNWTYRDAIALALANRSADPYGYRIEAVNLMRMAETLSR